MVEKVVGFPYFLNSTPTKTQSQHRRSPLKNINRQRHKMSTFRLARRTVRAYSSHLQVYPRKAFTTTTHKYEDAEDSNLKTGDAELKFPSEDSVARQVVKLKQDYEVHKLKIEHLTEKVDQGYQDMRDGFKRIDHWMMLLIGAFILKGGFDTVNSAGVFGGV